MVAMCVNVMYIVIALGTIGTTFGGVLYFETKSSGTTETDICPDGSTCSGTCCMDAAGKYGCCKYSEATCCADLMHCCPQGFLCNVEGEKCVKADSDDVFLTRIQVSETDNNVPCPSGQSCPDDNTCCELSSGDYGCCPHPDAVCCSDKEHCCPKDHKCNLATMTCDQDSQSIPWKSLAVKNVDGLLSTDVVCPGGKQSCEDGQTCCPIASGAYGCCPLAQAVCCSDKEHCCPKDHKCNLATMTCDPASQSIPWKSLAVTNVDGLLSTDIVCPGGKQSCEDGQTCCLVASGTYGCCPLAQAVCCSDKKHCCPKDHKCNLVTMTCDQDSQSIPWKSLAVKNVDGLLSTEVCPGGKEICDVLQTCCPLSSGAYGCCRYPLGVCCSDKKHCCPHGYECNSSTLTCDPASQSILWKSLAVKNVDGVPSNDVVCPGGQQSCPDQTTCCVMQSGHYGCCRYDQAVCCSDKLHCCPNGYTCNTAAGTCHKGPDLIEWHVFHNVPSNVMCPDGQTECVSGNTCCQVASGVYGCCPYDKAVCCEDNVHCCPSGWTCDTASGSCLQGAHSVSWNAVTVGSMDEQPSTVDCPGGKQTCPDESTCCKLSSGSYGCCPLRDAVCCSDGEHCCPKGYRCDVAQSSCIRDADVIPWSLKQPASVPEMKSVVAQAELCHCLSDQTCCESDHGYGCCPFENAVCCDDGLHCCPAESRCDTVSGMCQSKSNSLAISWNLLLRRSAIMSRLEAKDKNSITCPDKSSCDDDATCCELPDGRYGCCPYEQATCCSDKKHCCPHDTQCDLETMTCKPDSAKARLPWE